MSVSALISLAVSTVLIFVLPLFLYFMLRRKYRMGVFPVIVGAVIFFVFALVLESLLHSFVFQRFPGIQRTPWAYVLYGCLTAGIFEEVGRFVGLHFIKRNESITNAGTGLSYGVGHGGLEAILLVGVTLAQNLILGIRLTLSGSQALLQNTAPEKMAITQQQLSVLSSAHVLDFLLPVGERILAIILHLALSLLVWMIVAGRLSNVFLLLSIGLHALANVSAAMFQVGLLQNIWLVEAVFALGVAFSVAVVAFLYHKTKRHPKPLIAGLEYSVKDDTFDIYY